MDYLKDIVGHLLGIRYPIDYITVGMNNTAIGYYSLYINLSKYVVLSSMRCFDSNLFAYRLVKENGDIFVDAAFGYANKGLGFCHANNTSTANAVVYYHNNFDKWKLFYMALLERDDEFRDVFLNMVKYYCAF